MNKQAYEHTVGLVLSKTAAPLGSSSASSGSSMVHDNIPNPIPKQTSPKYTQQELNSPVGVRDVYSEHTGYTKSNPITYQVYSYPNTALWKYSGTLKDNLAENIEKILPKDYTSREILGIDAHSTKPVRRYHHVGAVYRDDDPRVGEPVLLKDLLEHRKQQATNYVDQVLPGLQPADEYYRYREAQRSDAIRYLMSRGDENYGRYLDGTLGKNLPTEVKLPKSVNTKDDRIMLDILGSGMANARIPGYTKNNIVG